MRTSGNFTSRRLVNRAKVSKLQLQVTNVSLALGKEDVPTMEVIYRWPRYKLDPQAPLDDLEPVRAVLQHLSALCRANI